ncbi:dihydrofolate reductase family protein [Cytobacillus spongiae]|jgi:dihydrofolate reductase|uniref:dihydrofolate reductase family protein n=1 Tax=Cytobacillus spongiae TaxID=2901381 RepID=UPI001F283C7C|nr:dihydrofolate reductase family protein [Cytobacillus spongiae]UII56111.1 dihydrofolate reductase family protein [Cytobacillus spongiae]
MNQRRKIQLFIAMSLDGYIATKEDSLDWLFSVEGEGDNGYSSFYEGIDTIIMGKRTYDWVMKEMKGEFPYQNKKCFVFSRSPHPHTEFVQFQSGNVTEFVHTLKQSEGKGIWIVGGGEVLHTFLKEKLVDEMIVTIAPVILGEGIPLFKEGDYSMDLHLKETNRYNQFVELKYDVKKA